MKEPQVEGRRWALRELESAVEVYRNMLRHEVEGRGYNKSRMRREALAGPLKGRSPSSFEFRMRNISAVLIQLGRPTVKGYAPAKHVGPRATAEIRAALYAVEASSGPVTRPPMVFFNIGWMKRYAGEVVDDPTLGNFRGLAGLEHGGEAFNFAPRHGRVYGYRPGEQRSLEIRKLGAERGETEKTGVLVVGWYRNATALRTSRDPAGRSGNTGTQGPISYVVHAAAEDAVLLPLEHRTFIVPSAKMAQGGFGMSPTWFGGSDDDMRDRVWRYIEAIDQAKAEARRGSGRRKPPRNPDLELRARVEQTAAAHAKAHFESELGGGYSMRSVELERKGWDLEHEGDDRRLLVEVKGLSGGALVCELTPNEYRKMCDPAHRSDYVIYVVTQCLEQTPLPHIFRYDEASNRWESPDGRVLKIDEMKSAVLRV
jgi:Domain of unknown function (DUF3883)